MKKYFKKILKLGKSKGIASQSLPAIIHSNVGDINLQFEALVKEDYSRIRDFDGELAYFERLVSELRPEDTFVDVGAFTGQVSCLAAKKCSRVISVEPDPEFCKRIRKNISLNGLVNIEVASCGLANEPGEMELNTSGGEGWAPSFLDKGLKDYIRVPINTLDGLMREINVRPNILKIDIEGFEFKALEGAHKTLDQEQLRAVYIEFHPSFIIDAGGDVGETIAILGQHGFKFEYFDPRKNEISAIARRM